jgi:hypothetical protein
MLSIHGSAAGDFSLLKRHGCHKNDLSFHARAQGRVLPIEDWKALTMQQSRIGRFRRVVGQALASIMVLAATFRVAPSAQARILKLDNLTPQAVAQMSAEARVQYQQALVALDRVLYERALSCLQAALKLASADDQLRFMVIQLAAYMGDTRWGSNATTSYHTNAAGSKEPNLNSFEYYQIAIDELQVMTVSPRLNPREQKRAGTAIDRLTALQQTIAERDGVRRQWGKEIDMLYLAKIGLVGENKRPKGQQPAGGNRAGGPMADTSGPVPAGTTSSDPNQGLTAASPLSFARGVVGNLASTTGYGR